MPDDTLPASGAPSRPPAAWTPENTAALITAAIREAQTPLLEAVRRRGVPAWLVLLLLFGGGVLSALGFVAMGERNRRLEREADSLRSAAENANIRYLSSQICAAGQAARLALFDAERERLDGELTQLRRDREKTEQDAKAVADRAEEWRRSAAESGMRIAQAQKAAGETEERARREGVLLRERISGLEQENAALARQIATLKALNELEPTPSAGREIRPARRLAVPFPIREQRGGVAPNSAQNAKEPENAPDAAPSPEVKALYTETGNWYDLAIEDIPGGRRCFFRLDRGDDNYVYTKDGAFRIDSEGRLVTADGYFLSPPLRVTDTDVASVYISSQGILFQLPTGATAYQEVGRLFLFFFENPDKLELIGEGRWRATNESGEGEAGDPGEIGLIRPGFLEQQTWTP